MKGADTPDGASIRAGLADIEGYLLWQGERERARTQAEAFADRMPWLTTGQRDELVGGLTRHHLALSRESVTRSARRATQLRQEYEGRYAQLRRRLLAAYLLLCTVAVFADCVLLIL